MQSQFSSQGLAEILKALYSEERSGVLSLSRAGVDKRIYFDRGMILLAESSLEDEDLGRRLVSEGKISQGALAEARGGIRDSKELAQALVNRGLIGKETLAHTARDLVERIVQSVFQWEGGTAQFSEGRLIQEIFEADVVTTLEVVLKGISVMTGFASIRTAMDGLDGHRLRFRRPAPIPVERLTLSTAHGYLLSRADGTTTPREILSLLPPEEADTASRFLYGMLVMGVLVLDPPLGDGSFQTATLLRDHADRVALERLQENMIRDACETFRDRSPSEVLGVAPTATRDQIEGAYQELKSKFSRERVLPRVREKLRNELLFVESRLVEAYLSLSQARPGEGMGRTVLEAEGETLPKEPVGVDDLLVRVELDKTRTRIALEENVRIAESYFAKARKFMREGDYFNAIQYAKLAISYNAEEARFHFLLADCQVRNPEARWQRMAEQSYLRAAELDPWNAEYRVSLGRFYKRRGLKLRARKQFEHVLQVVPGHEVALRELEGLG
jgi:tetratricopeptide (TPR) repeat protein